VSVSSVRNNSPVATTAAARAPNDPNAILNRYQPSGASAATARQDGLSGGVAASRRMAANDLPKLRQYADEFAAAGKKHGVPPALLAAIASRESRGGSALDRNGRGDGGNGFGLMQVDRRYHSPAGGPYSAQHIDQAAGILKGMLNQVKAKHPDWSPEQQLRGAVAAYNSGAGNVQTIAGMDRGTTGNDYSNDVWARAQALAPSFGGAGGGGGNTVDPKPSRPSTGGGSAASGVPSANLDRGDKGSAVEQLQKSLVKLGHMSAAEMKTGPGTFGPRTEDALKEFQKKHGLETDGKFGPKSRAAMEKALVAQSKPKPSDGFEGPKGNWVKAPTLEQVEKDGKVLRQNQQGPAVAQLQRLLGIEDDGKFGPGTKAAVVDFQKSHGLKPPAGSEGAVGPTTLAAIKKAAASGGPDGISARGKEQMRDLMAAAQRNSGGKRPQGWCLREVGDILQKVDYGNIGRGKAPRFPLARNFAEWLNKPGMADKMGLRKLNIKNPYDAPPGSIVVVRPGSPGTRHPTAGDIAISMGGGRFLNDGEMGYGGRGRFPPGNDYVLGVYVPK
jgi:peptidoglycan hydrolase-like protein with peptidoglycan-binding domain